MRPMASRALRIAAVIVVTTLAAAWWAWTVLAGHRTAVAADHRATQAATGSIVEVGVGDGSQFRVAWKDRDGRERTAVFSQAPGRVIYVGDPFAVRYDPGHPDTVFAQDAGSVQHHADTVYEGRVLVLLVGVPVLLCWHVRLIRWLSGTRGEARSARLTHRPVPVEVYRGTRSAHSWLELREPNGQVRYQLSVWEPWLTGLGSGQREVTIRTCPGGAYIVDVPGQGRLWPAGTARSRAPKSLPTPGNRGKLSNSAPVSTVVLYLTWLAFGAIGGLLMLSVIGGLYLLVLVLAIWHWFGLAAPGHSVAP